MEVGFPDGSVVKNSPANARVERDVGLVPGSGRCPGEEMASHSSIFVWEISWTEELVWLQSTSVQFSCSVMSDSLQPMDYSMPGLPVHHQLPPTCSNSCPSSR